MLLIDASAAGDGSALATTGVAGADHGLVAVMYQLHRQ